MRRWWRTTDLRLYVAVSALTAVCVSVMMRLWRANWSAPFYYSYDAQGSMAHFVTTIETGWYENQPRLGFPYGQHYHDFPFSDDLHLVSAKILGWVTGGDWVSAFNLYYLLTFLLVSLTALWFLRVCGLSGVMAVIIAVLYSVSPYHWERNETHLFLSGYYMIPAAMVLVLRVVRGQPLWGRRIPTGAGVLARVRSALTGRGAGTVLILALLIYSGVYYAVFVVLLLAVAALVALAGHRSWSRFGGAVVAGIVSVVWFALALLPDILYARTYGSNAAAFPRGVDDAQYYALRILAMMLPATDHPIPEFAELRNWFTGRYPPQAEYPTLGFIATVGFVLLLGVGLGRMMRARGSSVRVGSRRDTLGQLAGLTILATLIATAGGFGLLVSMASDAMRGWNRMSIVIALLALAAFGLAMENVAVRWRRSLSALPRPSVRQIVFVLAGVTLVVGVADQSLDRAVPDPSIAASFASDEQFYAGVEASLPAGAAVYQLPFRGYPEGWYINGTTESDQLRAIMHTKTLRFSGGGIKGRPQTEWPATVEELPTANFLSDLATVGFSGIIVDRLAFQDSGDGWIARLTPSLGAPERISNDGRWAWFPMSNELAKVALSTSPEQRHARSLEITQGAG
ncbi:hypothetical protein ABLG96_08275 [Nakamurella sp. A5-74]|uniref:YfhO family protein n=1 Tax=Nakamurella sp. A5-74 TaxID=3158264 RepID=A0AAU8DV72_9ACTN